MSDHFRSNDTNMGMPAKQTLRKTMKGILSSLSEETIRDQSSQIFHKLLSLEWYQNSKKVGVYLSMKEEVQTDAIVENILNTGKHCFIPWYDKDIMRLVRLESLEDLSKMPLTKWNIRQPADLTGREDAIKSGGLDLILVPGLAFSACGKRLGRGKGYYDKFLNELLLSSEANSNTLRTVGLAFNEQLVQDVPSADHDFTLDIVLTPDSAVKS